MTIAVPSKGRAGKTTTQKILPSATFYVPANEVHQYEGLGEIVAVPIEIRGITATRNWILKNAGDRVVFIDDDVASAGWVQLHARYAKQRKEPTEAFWLYEFEKLFDVTEQMGWKIWGVKTEAATRSVYPYKPFIFKTYVTASCMGIINDGEYLFDERFTVKEDYEICLRHIVQYGGILGARYLHWQNSHWGDEGGCTDYRTVEIEREAIRMLVEMYPGMIRRAKRKANVFTVQLNL